MKAVASAAALLAAGAAGLTCSDANSPQPVGLTLGVSSTSAVPGDILQGTILVETRGRRVDWLGLQASGYITERDSTAVNDASGGLYGFDLQLPFQPANGTLRLVAFARSGGARDTSTAVTVTVADAAPPTFDLAVARPLSPQPQQDLRSVFRARDNAGLVRVVVAWSGALTGADTFALTGFPREREDSSLRHVPRGTSPGRTVTASVTATDLAGQSTTQTLGPYTVIDSTTPIVTATSNAPSVPVPLLIGDTLRIQVNAADNHRLAWVGWRSGPPASVRDSVAATDTVVAGVSFTRVVPPSWVGNGVFEAFARDSVGNLRETFGLGSLFVIDAIRRPLQTGAAVTGVRDLVLDVPRNLAYLTTPGVNAVRTLSLGTLAFGASIPTPFEPGGLDLAPDGNTLVVALRGSPYVGIVDVNAASPVLDTVRLNFDAGDGRAPDEVRIGSNNVAIVTIASDSADHVPGLGRVVELRLATRTSTVRLDAGASGAVSPRPRLARAGNRSAVFLFYSPTCCTAGGQVYRPQSDAFSAAVSTGGHSGYDLSADSTGNRLLVQTTLYDGALTILGSVFPAGFTFSPTTLAPGGATAHFAQEFGSVPTSYATYQVPGGTRVERVMLPGFVTELWALPNGQSLLGVIGGQFVLVDLR